MDHVQLLKGELINDFSIIKAIEQWTCFNTAPIDHSLTSLFLARKRKITHVCLPY